MKGPGEIHLDGPKAVRTAGAVGLAVLGIALLPGLLRPPEPEPLPADVGFRPAENLGATTTLPTPAPEASRLPGAEANRPSRRGRTERPEVVRPRPGGDRAGGPPGNRRTGKGPRAPDGQPVVTAPAAPVEAAPAPVTTWAPPPAPAPIPETTGDGSLEFAPR